MFPGHVHAKFGYIPSPLGSVLLSRRFVRFFPPLKMPAYIHAPDEVVPSSFRSAMPFTGCPVAESNPPISFSTASLRSVDGYFQIAFWSGISFGSVEVL